MSFGKIAQLKSTPVDEHLEGLQSMTKVYTKDGSQSAFHSISGLQLDTDGKNNPKIKKYDRYHQAQTSEDQEGHWLSSEKICYIVIPGGFAKRHGGCKVGMLATVGYKGLTVHCVVADVGPEHKFGEGSIMLHQAIDGPRIDHEMKIIDKGIDANVEMLWYIGTDIGDGPFTQDDINRHCIPLWADFNE